MKHYLNQLVASQYFSFVVTVLLFVILYAAGIMTYKGFMRPQVFLNLFIDNAALIIVTVGITFTLLIGGIDLSVGAVLALCCMVLAYLLEFTTVPVGLAILIILLMGIGFGALQGYIITKFDLQPFIITLAGMFFCRGLTAVISRDTISITNPFYVELASTRIQLGVGFISVGAVIALLTLLIAAIVLGYTKFGRTVFAIGGNESSASLMGLPVFRTKVMVYTISGFCSALGGGGLLSYHVDRLQSARARHGNGRDSIFGHRRHVADRRRRIYSGYAVRRVDPGRDSDLHHVPGDAFRMVDENCGRCAALRIHCDAGIYHRT